MIAGRVEVGQQVRAAGRAVADIDLVAGGWIKRGEHHRSVAEADDVGGRRVVCPRDDVLDEVRGGAVTAPQYRPVTAVDAAPEKDAARDDRVHVVANVAEL